MAKTKELKKRSWGVRHERIVYVRFGSRLPCERPPPFSKIPSLQAPRDKHRIMPSQTCRSQPVAKRLGLSSTSHVSLVPHQLPVRPGWPHRHAATVVTRGSVGAAGAMGGGSYSRKNRPGSGRSVYTCAEYTRRQQKSLSPCRETFGVPVLKKVGLGRTRAM